MAETDEEKAAREAAEAATAEAEAADKKAKEDEEAGWSRMEQIVNKAVEEKLSSWSGPQTKKTTSSRSQQKVVAPQRKRGFLSGQFFSGLDPKE